MEHPLEPSDPPDSASAAGRAPRPVRGGGRAPRRRGRRRERVRWSTPVEDVVRRVVADQGVAFWIEPRGLLRTRPRVHVLLLPLRDVAVPGLDQEPLPGAGPDHWLVWQSASSRGEPTRLPTDGRSLAERLGTTGRSGTRVVEDGLVELMAAIYESRAT